MIPAIKAYYDNKPQVQRDEVMRSCGIAGQTLMLATRAMGYDSCPMDGFDYDAVAKIIKLPSDHAISFMIAIGKSTKEAWPRPGQLPTIRLCSRTVFNHVPGFPGQVPLDKRLS